MTTSEVVTTCGAVLNTHAGPLPLIATFAYTSADPMAVSMTLSTEIELFNGHLVGDQQTWVFARDLLDTALASFLPTGDGDVQIQYLPDRDLLKITLIDIHNATHDLFCEAEPIAGFVAKALGMVPADAETVDMDPIIAEIFAANPEWGKP